MNVRYRVELSQTERTELTELLSGGKHAARRLKRAQILLAADGGATPATRRSRPMSARAARPSIGLSAASSSATWRRRSAKSRAPEQTASSRARRKPCWWQRPVRSPTAGRARWTLELLSGELVRLTAHESVSRETVRRRLAENDLKPWRKDMW